MNNKTVQVGYTPNDFFYNKLPSFTLSDSSCNQLYNNMINIDCSSNLKDNSMNCLKKEICINKDAAINIFNTKNTHGKSKLHLDDTNQEYYYQYIQTINLGFGNILLLLVIFYKMYNS